MEIIFVKENASVSSSIDLQRGAYVVDALNQLQNATSISAKAALVDGFANGQGRVIQNMDTLPKILDYKTRQDSNASASSTLVQVIDAQFGQYATPNVKRYLLFMVTSNSVQYAVDASVQARSHGVTVYVVSLVSGSSSDFIKTLNSISQDPARVYTVPPSTGSELGQALSKCS